MENEMSSNERHYPQALKFAMIALLAFAVIIGYNSNELMVRLYCGIMFIAILNGWAAAEDDSIKYGNLYLLNDAICTAMYFLSLLELYRGEYHNFWLFSCIIFLMYAIWNKMLEVQQQVGNNELRKYIVCDLVACMYSLLAFLIVYFAPEKGLENYVQYIGMFLWSSLLLVWYYDFYIKKFRPQEKLEPRNSNRGNRYSKKR